MNLFEYQNKLPFTGQIDDLESFLDDIWKRREVNSLYETEDALKSELQRFLQISHKTKEIKSNKYVGVIHYNSCKINLLPKIFYDPQKEYDDNGITGIQKHILWYLSYCRKIRFPHYDCTLGRFQNDFFEILIYMFAKYSHETLNSILYHQYAEMNEDLGYVRGKLNVKKYVSENIVKARWHRLNCDFETFTMDNKFNRIVKYVCKLLLNETRNDDSKKYLREILFILEDVSDERATPEESGRIQFNPIFADLETIRDYCTLFLS
ncbi:MAG: hypothetical protein JNL74_24400, partial [Fibrobacteres bacterium]|nr:hypothetical protein [Fibrobacterota bacterium]